MNQKSNLPINLDQLHQISEGDIEFEIEVLQVYVEDVLQRIEIIRQAIANKDYTQIMKEAHHVKGSSSNVGALQMRDLAVQLEDLNLDQELAKAPNILEDMLVKMQAVEDFIAEKSANLPS